MFNLRERCSGGDLCLLQMNVVSGVIDPSLKRFGQSVLMLSKLEGDPHGFEAHYCGVIIARGALKQIL